MLKVLLLFGTRPEAIKLAPLAHELKAREGVDCRICVTAQHREMLDQVMDFFDLQADWDLDLMQKGQSLAGLSARILQSLEPVVEEFQPDWAIVQGDTSTCMVSALLAFYHQVRIAHVEAGLRTGDKFSPFPEEINRRITSVLADLHLAPTERNRDALIQEGIPAGDILLSGNTVIDALLLARDRVKRNPPASLATLLADLGERRMVLITGHRRESFGDGFEQICNAIRELALRFPGEAFVYPVHLNPRVQEPVHRLLSDLPNVWLVDPQPYPEFVTLMERSHLLLSDSGGVQEEAPSLGKPVLVMRNHTERQEGVDAGTARLVGNDRERIVSAVVELLENPEAWRSMSEAHNPYGDGKACAGIADALLERARAR